MQIEQRKLYLDPKLSYPSDLKIPFADYIAQCSELILQNRPDITSETRAKILAANAPFELINKPASKKIGVLLLHGLLDSPFMLSDIASRLHQENILVRSILLPGHGIVPGALLNVSYQDWLDSTAYGIATLTKEVDSLFIVGYSTGALLSVYHRFAAKNLAGLILLAPAFKIRSPWAFVSNWHQTLGRLGTRARWLSLTAEIDYAKYQSLPINAVAQVYNLSREVKKTLAQTPLAHPLFIATTAADTTISTPTVLKYFSKATHPNNQLILYSNQLNTNHAQIICRPTQYLAQSIQQISHVAIPISSANKHYGAQGDYIFASRAENNIHYGAYNSWQEQVQMQFNRFKLSKTVYRRSTFNPDFDFMIQEMIRFIYRNSF
jgi:esterase/lipase